MCLFWGTKSKFPCLVSLTLLKELSHLSKTFEAHTIDQAKHMLTIYWQKRSKSEALLKALGIWPVKVSFIHIILWYSWLSDSKFNHRMFSGELCSQSQKKQQVSIHFITYIMVSGNIIYSMRSRFFLISYHTNSQPNSRASKLNVIFLSNSFSLLLDLTHFQLGVILHTSRASCM